MNAFDWPIALSTGCFYRRPILETLHAVKSADFHQIEVCSFPAHLDYHDNAAVARAAQRLRELESENAKLKRLLAEAHLDMHALNSVLGVKR